MGPVQEVFTRVINAGRCLDTRRDRTRQTKHGLALWYASCMNTGDSAANDCRAVVKTAMCESAKDGYTKEFASPLEFCIFSKMRDATKMSVSIPEDLRRIIM